MPRYWHKESKPVWNKSHREHTIIGTSPATGRAEAEADAAVKALGWTGSYHVYADHIGLGNVDLFVHDSYFFTLDVADFTGKRAGTFVTEVSMDETDDPQTSLDMLFILAAIADEGIPAHMGGESGFKQKV